MNKQAITNKITEEEILQSAMVCFNISEAIANATGSEIEVEIKADYKNNDNPYWIALWPFLDTVDTMMEEEVSGRNVMLNWHEESALSTLSEASILKFKINTKRVDDIYETGRAGDFPISYSIILYKEKFEEYYEQITLAAKNTMTVPVQLSFPDLSNPVIKSANQRYELTSMREGNAYKIIVTCLEKHENETMSLNSLKEELDISGVLNINEALRKSHFDSANGLLRSFVKSGPHFIKVSKNIDIPITQFENIIIAAKPV